MTNEIIYCGDYVRVLQFRLPNFPAGVVHATAQQKTFMFRVDNLKEFVNLEVEEKERILLGLIPFKERKQISGSLSLSFLKGSKNDASTIATIQ